MSKPSAPEDPLRQYYVCKCKVLLREFNCLISLGGFEQRGPDPACVEDPDVLDYILHDVPVLILSYSEFFPHLNGLIYCPECKTNSHVGTDGWEPGLRTAVGLQQSIAVLSRRYRCTNNRKHGE